MELALKPNGSSFATRERARQIVAAYVFDGEEVFLDVADTLASPSFLAELFVNLSERASHVIVVGADQFQARTISRLAKQLGLEDRVKLAELV